MSPGMGHGLMLISIDLPECYLASLARPVRTPEKQKNMHIKKIDPTGQIEIKNEK
jgi:hypothetical protein